MVIRRKTRIRILLTDEQRFELESWRRSRTMRAGLVRRARIIVLLADGMAISHVAQAVGLARPHIYKWVRRFLEHGIDGLADKAGRGRKAFFSSGGRGPHREAGLRAA